MIQQQLLFEDFSVQVQKNVWKIEAYFCASSFQLFWNLPKSEAECSEISLSHCHFHQLLIQTDRPGDEGQI